MRRPLVGLAAVGLALLTGVPVGGAQIVRPDPPDPNLLPPVSSRSFDIFADSPDVEEIGSSLVRNGQIIGSAHFGFDLIRPYAYTVESGEREILLEDYDSLLDFEVYDVSEDGRWAAFSSMLPLVDGAAGISAGELYVLDRDDGDFTWISRVDEPPVGTSFGARFSTSASRVVFVTSSNQLPGDMNGSTRDAYLYDFDADSLRLVSTHRHTNRMAGGSTSADITDDGRIAGYSVDNDLVFVDLDTGEELVHVMDVGGSYGYFLFAEGSVYGDFTLFFSALTGLIGEVPDTCAFAVCTTLYRYDHVGSLSTGVGTVRRAIRTDGPIDAIVDLAAVGPGGALLVTSRASNLVPDAASSRELPYVISPNGVARRVADDIPDERGVAGTGFLTAGQVVIWTYGVGWGDVETTVVEMSPFDDAIWHFHEGGIRWAAESTIVDGCGPRRFCPDAPLTRAQMASVLARALDLPAAPSPFDDVSGVHAANIGAVAAAGITVGCSEDGTLFCPNATVTRAQMATFVARALGLDPVDDGPFEDAVGVHAGAINAIAQAGITAGCRADAYCPLDSISRGQVTTLLYRALEG